MWTCILVLCVCFVLVSSKEGCDEHHNRLDVDLRQALCGGNSETPPPLSEISVIIDFDEKADLSSLEAGPRAKVRGQVREHLGRHADSVQHCVRAAATRFSLTFTPYWIINAMFIKDISLATLDSLIDSCPDVQFRVRKDQMRKRSLPVDGIEAAPLGSTTAWNIEKINAPAVWELGFNGTGVTVATIDGGVAYDHVALKYNYRGATEDGRNIDYDHDYNWQDWAYQSKYPSDNDGHGTNVQGIATATESSGVGVAMAAKWMSAKVFNYAGYASDSWILAAAQWVQCPTPVNDLTGDERCDLGADVVSCSWGFDAKESAYDFTSSWVAAGMIPVFAVGNSGPDCDSVVAPSTFAGVLGVGGTDKKDKIVGWSSRGPGPSSKGYSPLTPALVAPGLSITGPDYESTTSYTAFSGTSQACPHVAGVAALLLSADPSLSVEEVSQLITDNTVQDTLPQPDTGETSCGGKEWNDFPNYIYGSGRLDALAAVNALLARRK